MQLTISIYEHRDDGSAVPLLFDHVQEVTVVHYPLEYRAKREPIVPAERRGKPKDRNSVLSRLRLSIVLRTLNVGVKEG
jgi:hypothetical protein